LTAGTGSTVVTTGNPLLGRNGPRSGAGVTSMTANAAGSDDIGTVICEIAEPLTSSMSKNNMFLGCGL
jgi:hypothetical protein